MNPSEEHAPEPADPNRPPPSVDPKLDDEILHHSAPRDATPDEVAASVGGVDEPLEPKRPHGVPAFKPIRGDIRREMAGRGLVLAWCLWLLGSWAVTLWADSAVPAVRWMVFAAVIGLMVLWPLLRLSQDPTIRVPGRGGGTAPSDGPAVLRADSAVRMLTPKRIFTDWLSLILVFQAVVWPLRLTAGWSVPQTLWLDAAITAWSLLVAAVVALGCLSPFNPHRTAAMALCMALLFGEPLLQSIVNVAAGAGGGPAWTMRVSPIHALWDLTRPPAYWQLRSWPEVIVAIAIAALAAWAVVAASSRRFARSAEPG